MRGFGSGFAFGVGLLLAAAASLAIAHAGWAADPPTASGAAPRGTSAPPPASRARASSAFHRPLGGEVKLFEGGKAHANLTEGECRQLGGDVYPQSGCDSEKACLAIDPSGGEHWVCIGNAQ